MNDTKRQAELSGWQFTGVAIAVIVIAVSMGCGFWFSFHNLSHAAAAHGFEHPTLLPLGVDAPIVAFVILDQVAVTLHARGASKPSRTGWLHYAAWGLAAFTVWANAAVAPPDGSVWRIIYAAQPALWVLGVEALRYFWRLWRKGPAKAADKIPAGRWIANPATAALLQRRMWLLGETSWARMSLLEDARQYARDLIRAGEKQDRDVPAMLRSRVRSGRLPEPVLAAVDTRLAYPTSTGVEQAVQSWVASLMVLPELVSADLRKAAEATLPTGADSPVERAARQPVEHGSRQPAERAPNFSRVPSPTATRKMSPADLAPFVKTWIEQGNEPVIEKVAKRFRIGERKAKDALIAAGLWGDDAPVVQLSGRV